MNDLIWLPVLVAVFATFGGFFEAACVLALGLIAISLEN